jgi:hypothetical protein
MTNIGVSVPEEDLAVRCEQATGPDRELDARLHVIREDGFGHRDQAPDYTASIDAALSLVPEGWRIRDFGDWEDRWLITLMNEDTCDTVGGRSGRGQPALALCAAALRARVQGHSS